MSTFTYTALDKTNAFVKGKIEGKNEKKAVAKLEGEGFMIVNIKEEKVSRFIRLNNLLNNVNRLDLIFFTRHLHTMLESGIGMDQAVKISAEQVTNEKFRQVLNDIHQQVLQGQTLHAALSKHDKYFSHFYINVIKIGEKSGKLDEVLGHLLEQQENDYELITKARNSMLYPIIIIIALLLMVTMMMIFVIPRVTGILSEYDVELPLATKVLIGTNSFFLKFGIILLPVVILAVYLLRRWIKTPKGKRRWDSLLMRLPYLKGILIEFYNARITRSLSALLKSGIAIDQAVKLVADATSNTLYAESLDDGLKFIRRGLPIGEVLAGHPKLYPPITRRMIEVGERTGKLDHMLTRLAIFYERSVTNKLGNLATVIEPVLLLLVGLVVAFVAIAVLTPIWKFSDTI
ncbi:MAG: type II secretion system F family protein [Patescibacteria group bacterium]